MPFIPVPNGARVALEYAFNSRTVVNTLWFQHNAGSITQLAIDNLLDGVENWWVNYLKPTLSDDLTLSNIVAVAKDAQQSFAGQKTIALAGDLVGPTLPANVAFALKFTTGFTGRSSRGRNFIPCIRETDCIENAIAVNRSNDLVGAYRELMDGGLGAVPDWTFSVVSFVTNKAFRNVAQVLPVKNVGRTSLRIDSQRRRTGRE